MASSAVLEHSFQFVAQGIQALNPPFDGGQVRFGCLVSEFAGLVRVVLQREQRSDCVYFKSELARMSDERKALEVLASVEPPLILPASGRGE